jgi:hypothetical protein
MKKESKYHPAWRPAFSIVVGVGWLIFIIIWLAFYADVVQPWERNISVFLLSILVAFLLLGGVWAIWALRMIPKEGWEMMRVKGFKSRITVSIILPFAGIIFLIYWFWFHYQYSIWQHIAVILVTLLIVGGILGAIWARWGMKHSGDFEKRFEKMGEDIGKKVEDAVKAKEDKEDED